MRSIPCRWTRTCCTPSSEPPAHRAPGASLVGRPHWCPCGSLPAPGEDGADTVVARAYDQKLHWSDLRQVIPMEVSAEDSAVMAPRYIDQLAQPTSGAAHGGKNLSAEDKDLERSSGTTATPCSSSTTSRHWWTRSWIRWSGEDIAQYYEAIKPEFRA